MKKLLTSHNLFISNNFCKNIFWTTNLWNILYHFQLNESPCICSSKSKFTKVVKWSFFQKISNIRYFGWFVWSSCHRLFAMTFKGFSYRYEWEFNVCFILPEMLIELTPYTLCAEYNLQLEALRALQQILAQV